MRAVGLLVALLIGAAVQQAPLPVTPASLLLATDASHVDEKLLSAALAHSDANVRAAAARLIGVFSVAPLAQAVATALQQETDARAGAELARALLFLRGDSAKEFAQAAAQRIGGVASDAVKTWSARNAAKEVAVVPNDLMFSRTVTVWLPGLLSELAAAAKCGLSDDPRFGYVRLTYRSDGRPRRVEIDKAKLSKPCASVLAAIGRTTLADEGQPAGEGYQQWIIVPFSRSFAMCTEQLDTERELGAPAARTPPRKIKDVRPQYPREMQAQRISGLVFAQGLISTRGCITQIRVTKGTGLPFELEALRAMSGWQFEPATHQGNPVPVRTTFTVSFSVR